MGTVWVRELTGGLDTRRLFEAAEPNILVKAVNGHINSGGEFEKRFSFVSEYDLPSGTIGLSQDVAGLVVFGHGAEPAGLPTGVAYQRLQHPDSASTALTRVLSTDLFQGKVYAVAEFEDGSVHHYFDGDQVTDWYDGRARAAFDVTGGSDTPAEAASGSFEVTGGSAAVAASGSFEITGGTSGAGNEISDVLVDGVDVLGAAVAHTGDNATTADAVAAQINSYTSSPDYSASASGAVVTITAEDAGADANGNSVSATIGGDVTVDNETAFSGGADAGRLTELRVGGVNIIASAVEHTGDDDDTADAVAAAVNGHTSSPDYSASASGGTVTITAATAGSAANGRSIAPSTAGDFTTDNATELSGGADAVVSRVTDIQVDGVSIIDTPVDWTNSNTDTAAAIAAAINSFTSAPDYTATSAGTRVNILAADAGAEPNGREVDVTTSNGLTVDPDSGLEMAGGADPSEGGAYQPGTFVKTVGSKMYSVSGSAMHYSGIQQPTQWTTDSVGAGFVDLSSESAGFEMLTALARYQEYVAAFSERGIQVWYIDPDPDNYRISQTLNNTGTASPNSVTQFGDEDVFYLDESGLRSLRSRATINIASTTDVGVPVDTLITEKLRELTDEERTAVYGLIEPASGRFWLVMKDTIFVFSHFQGANVSAWSVYETTDADGATFDVEYATVHERRVYLRAGDTIYCYGGAETGQEYDEVTEAEVWSPYLDAGMPTAKKSWDGIDVACRGEWRVFAAMSPTEEDLEIQDEIGRVWRTTFNSDAIPFEHDATHLSVRFRSVGGGPHKISAIVAHFQETGRDS